MSLTFYLILFTSISSHVKEFKMAWNHSHLCRCVIKYSYKSVSVRDNLFTTATMYLAVSEYNTQGYKFIHISVTSPGDLI